MRQTFTINSPVGESDFNVQFKQHLVIPQTAKLQVNFIQLKLLSPQAGYLEDAYSILTDLPIKTFFSAGSIPVKKNNAILDNLLCYVPLQNQTEQNLDDPAALPTAAGFTYEPHQPLIHDIDGNTLQLNSMNFKITEGETLIPLSSTLFQEATICFTIITDE
jgi:hypothetical protein